MDRRKFLTRTTQAAAAGIAMAHLNRANAAEGESVSVSSDIGSNHGHELNMDVPDVINLLRDLQPQPGETTIDIQGASGHPHTITVNFDQLLDLLLKGELSLESSVDRGHSHGVSISLAVNAPT